MLYDVVSIVAFLHTSAHHIVNPIRTRIVTSHI